MTVTTLDYAVLAWLICAVAATPALTEAEARLLSGDPAGALRTLKKAPDGPAKRRLEVDSYVALQDRRADAAVSALAQDAGWEPHVRSVQVWQASRARWALTNRLGSLTFALCLGLLILGGGRSVLAVRREVLVLLAAGALLMAAASLVSKPLMGPLGILPVATVGLMHAATATVRRTAAGPRARAMIVVLLVLGFGGAVAAILGRLGLGGLLRLVA